MSRILSELLGATEPLFSIALKQLENASGNPSADVRLSAEIIGKVHMKTRELGLDPKDTTGKELYQALISLVEKHDQFLANYLGGRDASDVQDMLPRIKNMVDKLHIPKQAWVLKHSVAKRLLKATPPRSVMKHLGYRSVDSMLKREPAAEIFGATRFMESAEWSLSFIAKYKKLQTHDFESRQIEIMQLDVKKWGTTGNEFVNKKRHGITHLKEFGIIIMLPMPVKSMPGITITLLPLLIHYINEIRLYSAYFKLQQVRPDFSEIVVSTLHSDPANHAVMAGQNIHWRVIQKYFGSQDGIRHPEIFEPHVQPEDLSWRKAEEVLYHIEPALKFWHDMDYVGTLQEGRPISFNLMDIAISYVNNLPYSERAVHHVRESLWNEIFMRYMGQRTLENQILRQLDNEMIEPEKLVMRLMGRV